MTEKFMSMKNLQFTLHTKLTSIEKMHAKALGDHNKKSIDMVLDAAYDFAQKALHPIFEEMDRNPPVLSDGQVLVHADVRNILKVLGKRWLDFCGFPGKNGMVKKCHLSCSIALILFWARPIIPHPPILG